MKFQLLAIVFMLGGHLCTAQTSYHPVFPQTEINSVLGSGFQRSLSAQPANINQARPAVSSERSLIPALTRMRELQRQPLQIRVPNSQRSISDTVYVGATNNDTLVITGNYTHNGPIFVFNNGVLIFRNAVVSDTGDIYVWQNGKLFADSSSLTFPQQYFYEWGITLVNDAYMRVQNCSFNYSGMSHNLFLGDSAVLIWNSVHQNDWTTCGLFGNPTIHINGCNQTGEYILSDYSTIDFHNADTIIFWHQFPDTALVNYAFPNGDTVYHYVFNDTVTGVRGIRYNVLADTCHDVMWAMMPVNGSNITISNSTIRAIGCWFMNNDTVTAMGLYDNSNYTNFTAPLSDRNLHLINSSVQTWSLYAFDLAHLSIDSCTLGEVGCQERSSVLATNFLLDGSGGYFWATDTSAILASVVTVYSTARSERNGIFLLEYSWLPYAAPSAIDNSVMICVQNNLVQDPVAYDNGNAWLIKISGPDTTITDSLIPVPGSAWIEQGPEGGYMFFASYSLSYQLVGDTSWTPIVMDSTSEIHAGTLGMWNTHRLAAGNYMLKLSVLDNFGDSVYGLSPVTLLPGPPDGVREVAPTVMSAIAFPNPSDGNFVFEISSNRNSPVTIEIENAIGKKVFTQNAEIVSGKNIVPINVPLPAGIYFYDFISDNITSDGKVVVR
jgi:hypothetical protein